MITKMVSFQLPQELSREEVLIEAHKVVPEWQENPDLVRKYFLLDENNRTYGFYVWKTREAAENAHGEEFLARLKERFGVEPEMEYHDLMLILDNDSGEVVEP